MRCGYLGGTSSGPTGRRLRAPSPSTAPRPGIRIQARSRTSGDRLPIGVTLTTPDGQLVIARTILTVHSTSISLVGVALTCLAALVLLVWWARTWRAVAAGAQGPHPTSRQPNDPAPMTTLPPPTVPPSATAAGTRRAAEDSPSQPQPRTSHWDGGLAPDRRAADCGRSTWVSRTSADGGCKSISAILHVLDGPSS